jgi:hypothetical protein
VIYQRLAQVCSVRHVCLLTGMLSCKSVGQLPGCNTTLSRLALHCLNSMLQLCAEMSSRWPHTPAAAAAVAAAAVWQPCAGQAALQTCNAEGSTVPAPSILAPGHLLHGQRGCSHSSRGVQLVLGVLQQPTGSGVWRCYCCNAAVC